MEFDIQTARPVLARTPVVLNTLLRDLPAAFVTGNEGPDTWSPFDVVGHLVQGERNDWIPRVNHLLSLGESAPFPKFDRLAQFENSRNKTLDDLLDEFSGLRVTSLKALDAMQLTAADLERTGTHSVFGRVTLSQLLATWMTHDLDHLMQISRCMARQYTDAVGPWYEYLRIVKPV